MTGRIYAKSGIPQRTNSWGVMCFSLSVSKRFMKLPFRPSRAARFHCGFRRAARVPWMRGVPDRRAAAHFRSGPHHLDAIGQHEGTLELPRGNAAMKVDPLLLLGLLAADDELVVFDLDGKVVHREAGDRQGDAQGVLAELLDIVGRVSIGCCLGHPVERSLELVEAEQ